MDINNAPVVMPNNDVVQITVLISFFSSIKELLLRRQRSALAA